MARRYSEQRERSQLTRGLILSALQKQVDRERGDKESPSTYMDEDLLFLVVAKRIRQTMEMLRGELYYLRDKGYVKFKEVRVGSVLSLQWRITASGRDLLEGTATDPGVNVD